MWKTIGETRTIVLHGYSVLVEVWFNMGAYDDRPWLSQYPANRRGLTDTDDAVTTILDAFARLTVQGDKPLLHYDATLTAAEIDVQSDAFAVALQDAGFQPGERAVVCSLQNIPQFVIAQLAVWKAGGIVVSAKPDVNWGEFGEIPSDSGCRGAHHAAVAVPRRCLDHPETGAVRTIVTTSELEYPISPDATRWCRGPPLPSIPQTCSS